MISGFSYITCKLQRANTYVTGIPTGDNRLSNDGDVWLKGCGRSATHHVITFDYLPGVYFNLLYSGNMVIVIDFSGII